MVHLPDKLPFLVFRDAIMPISKACGRFALARLLRPKIKENFIFCKILLAYLLGLWLNPLATISMRTWRNW